MSVCLCIRIAFSHQWVRRVGSCYGPFGAAEYTDNGKINSGAVVCWPVNQKTVFSAKTCVCFERPRIFMPQIPNGSPGTPGSSHSFGLGSLVYMASFATV